MAAVAPWPYRPMHEPSQRGRQRWQLDECAGEEQDCWGILPNSQSEEHAEPQRSPALYRP
eukprot:10029865-Karenia_brevis.AAC.1